MIFEATEYLHIPADITVWDFLLSDAAPFPLPASATTGYTDFITGQRLTFHQTHANSIRLANVLYHRHGIRPGDIVGVCSANSIWYASCALAIMRIGATPAYLSQLYSADEMHHALTISSCRAVFTSEAALPVVSKASAGAGISAASIFTMDGSKAGYKSLQELLSTNAPDAPTFRIPKGKNNHDYPAALNFSSGTTGLPKAVMLSHQNLIAQFLQVRSLCSDDQKVMLAVLPMYHVTGLAKLFLYPIMMNMETVIISKFTMPVLLDAVVKYQMTDLQLVPPIVIRFVRDSIVKNYDLSCVKRFSTGAAPMSDEILTLMEATFPNAGIQQGYGMTESTACITRHPRDVSDYKYARTGGKPVANTLVKIVKEDGTLAGVGEEGEVRAKGPQICMGYYNNPQATADTFDEEGFLRTGDQGSFDEEGFLTIHDRIKELIKVKGVQVPPAELEDCLLGHPKVEDAGVVGIPDDYSGERPFAFVVVKPEFKAQRDIQHELDAYIKEKKSRPKWLAGIAIVDAIPKSAAGKILRKELKKDVKKYTGRLQAKL